MNGDHVGFEIDTPADSEVKLSRDLNRHLKSYRGKSQLLWRSVLILKEHGDHSEENGYEVGLEIDS